jgi:hypothetical protein
MANIKEIGNNMRTLTDVYVYSVSNATSTVELKQIAINYNKYMSQLDEQLHNEVKAYISTSTHNNSIPKKSVHNYIITNLYGEYEKWSE